MNRKLIPHACALLSAALLLGGCTMMPKYERPPLPVADSFKAEAAGAGRPRPASRRPAAPRGARRQGRPLAGVLHRRAPPVRHRPRAREQPRPEGRDPQRRAGRGPLPDPALRALPDDRRPGDGRQVPDPGEHRQGRAGEHRLDVHRRPRHGLLGARPLRAHPEPERPLPRAVPRDRGGPARRADLPRRRRRRHAGSSLAANEENLRISQATLEAQRASYELIRQSRDAGIGSDLELRQAQSQVEAARAAVAAFTGAAAVSRNALELLAGAPVPADLLPERLVAVTDPKGLQAGLPSDVLLRRPDILAAEHQLRGANANIGAARAAFFPRISLTAGFGTSSPDLDGLFKSGTSVWSFAGQIVSPLFASGSLIANLKVSKLDREIAVATVREGDPDRLRRGERRAHAPDDARRRSATPRRPS